MAVRVGKNGLYNISIIAVRSTQEITDTKNVITVSRTSNHQLLDTSRGKVGEKQFQQQKGAEITQYIFPKIDFFFKIFV